jgi:hypothetical protein
VNLCALEPPHWDAIGAKLSVAITLPRYPDKVVSSIYNSTENCVPGEVGSQIQPVSVEHSAEKELFTEVALATHTQSWHTWPD